jgi:hypothetical protein
MQDSGKAHLVQFLVAALDEVFSSWMISYGLPNHQIWMSIIICEDQWRMKFMWKPYIPYKNWKILLKE